MEGEKNINKVIYPEISYQLVGILFSVYNNLGYGYQEKYYQRAISLALRESKLKFKEQVSVPLKFNNNKIGNYFLDFLIEYKIVLEIKKTDKFRRKDIEQTYAYLKALNLKLGILANFAKSGLQFKRILNIK